MRDRTDEQRDDRVSAMAEGAAAGDEPGSAPGGLPQRAFRAFRRVGPLRALQILLHRLRERVFDQKKLLLFAVDVRQIRRVEPVLHAGESFSTRVLTPDEASAMIQSRDRNVMRGHLDGALGMELLLAGFINGHLVAWNLVACPPLTSWPLGETVSNLKLSATDAVFTAGFVVPEFRGRRIFQAMYTASANLAAERGAIRMWSWCEEWNKPSENAMLAVGFQPTGSHARWRLLGFRGPVVVKEGDSRTAAPGSQRR